jgi:hypothetical protein
MEDICTVCGLPTHADADEGHELCRRCYWWLDDQELEKFERIFNSVLAQFKEDSEAAAADPLRRTRCDAPAATHRGESRRVMDDL